ncbi:MAG: hypothetical protein GY699_02045 [Desulfobacteraceae bacterium]|nr:hypothetical protein [Desulfobacteraceae bacterium]
MIEENQRAVYQDCHDFIRHAVLFKKRESKGLINSSFFYIFYSKEIRNMTIIEFMTQNNAFAEPKLTLSDSRSNEISPL